MEVTIVAVLLLVGILFLLLELFLIPGISLAGIAGVISMFAAVYYSYSNISSTAGHITLISGIILTAISVWIFVKSKALEKMALKAGIDGKIDPLADVKINVGDKGVTLSRLAPMGKVKVNGYIIEAKTNDDFIDEGSDIVVLEILKTNILVDRSN